MIQRHISTGPHELRFLCIFITHLQKILMAAHFSPHFSSITSKSLYMNRDYFLHFITIAVFCVSVEIERYDITAAVIRELTQMGNCGITLL
jgi:hypothetical protein